MKIIRMIYPVIGIMLALVVCITPVVAVSTDDFEVDILKDEDGTIMSYMYYNMKSPDEEYIKITTKGTTILCSLVTFRPVNIPGAPVMVVNTDGVRFIDLPRSVDEWEIKYYSKFGGEPGIDNEYLKCYGIVNLNKKFEKYIEKGLYLALKQDQVITCMYPPYPSPKYYIPSVPDWRKEEFDECCNEVLV